jgi:phytoene dehydrogenase-like protein
VINSWDPIDAPQNHVIVSIPSVLDPTMAPPGCHTIHAYAAANEPYDLYEPFSSNAEYQARNVFNIYSHLC